jgi:hypothetical protein
MLPHADHLASSAGRAKDRLLRGLSALPSTPFARLDNTMSARNHASDEKAAGFIKRHPLASFLGLAFAGSWALAVILRGYLQATGTPVTMTQAGLSRC